uniref:VWACP-7 n=1 Tax=Colubraria reticulata TaxID=604273 RepID=A0AA96ZPA2_9CAEN|nr:VWACP-7 [Colubraria reticulata]
MFACILMMVITLGISAGEPPVGDSMDDEILKECQNQQSDIYFLLDSSSSQSLSDFQKLKDFVVSFVKQLDIGPNTTRVGLGLFASDFFAQFDLGQHSNKNAVIQAVQGVNFTGGGTYTSRGLRGMRTSGFEDGVVRKKATKIGVVVTDGRTRHRTDTLAEASELEDMGVWLFAIGVGSRVDERELSIFSSEPHREFLRYVPTFDDLAAPDLLSHLASSACNLQPPHADNAMCGGDQKADILFVYNAVAMTPSNLSDVQAFTVNLIRNFSMTSGKVRVGLVSEGRQGGDIALSQYIRKEDIVWALKHQRRSEIAELLRKVRQQGYKAHFGGRTNAKKFAIIFMNDADITIDAMVEAQIMTYNDVIVYVIEVGLDLPESGFNKYPWLRSRLGHVLKFASYAELLNPTGREEREKFIKKLCRYM